MIDERWTRWITASVNTYLKAVAANSFIKGENIASDALVSWSEIRIVGPNFKETTQDNFVSEIYVDVICNAKEQTNGSDIYLLERLVGKFVTALRSIPVKNHVDSSPASIIGCFTAKEDIETIPYGLIDSNKRQYQTVVCCRLEMSI